MNSMDIGKTQQSFISDTTLNFPGTPRSQVIGSIPGDVLSTTASAGSVGGGLSVPTKAKYQYLAVYFAFNLGLTIYNKVVMGKFPFPYLLTSLHTAAGSLGCQILLMRGSFTVTRLGLYEKAVLVAFSFLYTVNIAISNVSLNLVTIPFHQVLRATTPIFTIFIYRLLYAQTYSVQTYLSLIPIILGVACATYGDYYFFLLGFFLTTLGAFLAAVKTVTANRIQTGRLRLSALEILYRMSPLALVQALAYAYMTGEFDEFKQYISVRGNLRWEEVVELVGNAVLAFGLNIISFTANKKTGGLTMAVAANLKQVLTIVLSVLIFELKVGWLNGFGIILTLLGGAWYAKVELESKPIPRNEPPPPLGPMTDMKFDKEVYRFV